MLYSYLTKINKPTSIVIFKKMAVLTLTLMNRYSDSKQANTRYQSHIVFLKNNAVLIQPLRNTIDSRMRVKASTYSNSQKFLRISKQPDFYQRLWV
jgi:hypothetical protein